MTSLPFQVDSLKLQILEAVRILPQRRYVCRARFDEREVYVKFFTGKNAATYFEREKLGLETLAKHQCAGPQLLQEGSISRSELPDNWQLSGDKVYYTLCPAITAPSALNLWQGANRSTRIELMERFIALLSTYHKNNFIQSDIHLGNFLVSEDKIYCLDGDGIKTISSTSAALENLACFCAQAGFQFSLTQDQIASAYGDIPANFMTLIQAQRDRRVRKLSEKVLRNCTAVEYFIAHKQENYLNCKYDSPELRELMADPSSCLKSGNSKMLKDGNTCTVYSTQCDQRTIIIKRYNARPGMKGKIDNLRSGRSRNCWSNSFVLADNGLNCPDALACIIKKDGLKRTDYFIACEASGMLLSDFVCDSERAKLIAPEIFNLFSAMRQARMTHGDFKATNFFVTQDNKIEIIDMDSMCFHQSDKSFEKDFQKDLKRFHKNWQGGIAAVFQQYLSQI